MAGRSSLTAELITGMMLPSDPQVSADGGRVAYTVQAATKSKD
jgi:hypothetical protein